MSTPTLYLPIAIPGTGKTVFSKRFVRENPGVVYLSSDGLRGVLGKDENDQAVSGAVYVFLRHAVEFFLKNEISVLVDATNYNRKNRQDFIDIADKYCAWKVAFTFSVPYHVSKARNESRERVVPEFVLERMRDNFQPPDLVSEFDQIISVDDYAK